MEHVARDVMLLLPANCRFRFDQVKLSLIEFESIFRDCNQR